MDDIGRRLYLGEARQELRAIRDRADGLIQLIDLLNERGPIPFDPIDLSPEVARMVRDEERVKWIVWASGMLAHLEVKLVVLLIWWRRANRR